MKLLTKAILKQLPPLYANENKPAGEAVAYVHFFIGGCDWWLTEFDPIEGLFFGLCSIQEKELGYVSLAELEMTTGQYLLLMNLKGLLGLHIERDLHWTPTPLKEIAPDIFS